MIAHNQPLYEALFLKEDSSFIRTLLRVVVLPGAKSLNQGYIFLLTVTAVQDTAAVQDNIINEICIISPFNDSSWSTSNSANRISALPRIQGPSCSVHVR